jgi:hypothetical protein
MSDTRLDWGSWSSQVFDLSAGVVRPAGKSFQRCVMARKKKASGPVPPQGGRVRVTVNLPRKLLPFVETLTGRSLSDKFVYLVEEQQARELSFMEERNACVES